MSHAKPYPTEYDKVPELNDSCQGCVGEHDGVVCFSLPTGCVRDKIIWVDAITPQQLYIAALEQDIG